MKNPAALILLMAALSLLGACKNEQPSSAPPAPGRGATESGNSNVSAAPAGAAQPAPGSGVSATPPITLSGVYTISEVQDKGVVTMWPPDNRVEFIFNSDGTYGRKSLRRGRVDHADTGQYRVEDGKYLVLSILYSDNKVQVPAKEIRHTISLSPDGDSLTMTSKDGKVAVFRKTGEAPGN